MATIHGIVASPSPSTVRDVLALQPDAPAQRVILTGLDVPFWSLCVLVFKIIGALFVAVVPLAFLAGLLWGVLKGLALLPTLIQAWLS